jgi:hypothetical protein
MNHGYNIILLAAVIGITSCYYSQPSQDAQHAVVDFQQGTGFLNLKGINFVIVSLNGARPERWFPGNNSEERYRIIPGVTNISAYVYGSDNYQRGEATIKFIAKIGKVYDVSATEQSTHFDVKVSERDGKVIWGEKVEKGPYSTSAAPIIIPVSSN